MRCVAVDDDVIVYESRAGKDRRVRLVVARSNRIEDVACWRGRRRSDILDLKRRRRACRTVVRGGLGVDFSCGDIEAEDGPLENLEGGFGLVGRDLVAGLIDARKGKVAVLADLAADVAAVDLDVLVAGRVEGGSFAIVHGQRVFFSTNPCT